MSQLDLICEMGAEFAHLPDGPPDEGTMRLRLPFEQMETLKGYVDDLRLKGESRSQAIARIVRYVAKKHLRIHPISRSQADDLCRRYHYSGKPYPKSQVHLGAFWRGDLHGVMCFGAPIDRRRVLHLVEGTEWHEMCELNRMAFGPALPRNSESRSLAIAFRLFEKHAPQIKWILSYADGAQSGSGAIYRATGWLLTQVKQNKSLYVTPDGRVVSDIGMRTGQALQREFKEKLGRSPRSHRDFVDLGFERIDGKQYRYIKLLKDDLKLTCDVLPYDRARP